MCYSTQLSTFSILLMALAHTPTTWLDTTRQLVRHWSALFTQAFAVRPGALVKDEAHLVKAQATYAQARQLFERGDVDAALSLSHVARDLYADTQDYTGLGRAEQLIAAIFETLGQPDLARAALRRARAVYKQPDDEAQVQVELARLARAQGRVDEAVDALRQAGALFKKLKQPQRELEVVTELGYLLYEQGQWVKAEKVYRRALRLAEALRLEHSEDSLMLEIGNALAQQGKVHAARTMFERSIDSAKATGDKTTLAAGLHSLAITYALADDYEQANMLFRNSLRLSQETGNTLGMAYTLYEMGLTQAAGGRREQARQLIERAGELYAELDAPEVDVVCWTLEQLELFEPGPTHERLEPAAPTRRSRQPVFQPETTSAW